MKSEEKQFVRFNPLQLLVFPSPSFKKTLPSFL